ncbi:MAG: PQQ-binding-like beta-propeller repeat protein [Vulcanimicrobiota bacterium]
MEITCPRCGYENEEEQEFCSQCEFPLAEAALLVHHRYRMARPYVFSTFRAVYEAYDVRDNNKRYSVREFLPLITHSGEKLSISSQFEILMNKYQEMSHPNLAGIADYFIEGNYYYIVYDFVNGKSLDRYMSRHKIMHGKGYPPELVTHWALQMCDLFNYFHSSLENPVYLVDFRPRGVVFRQEDERLVFIDMGLSKTLSLLGPHYLITEDFQAFRKAGGKLETKGWDLFCLGNFIYYLLTGVDLLSSSIKKFPEPVVINPKIPDKLNQIVMKALGENFVSGYEDVGEIIEDLQGLPTMPLSAYDFYKDFVASKFADKATEWRMLLGNPHRTGTVGEAPRIPVKVKWLSKIKPSSKYFIFPCDNYIYALSKEGMLFGLDHQTGHQGWKFFVCNQMAADGVGSSGVLYYATPLNELVAVEHGQANFLWRLQLESSCMASPFLYEDMIFVPLYNGSIYAVNAEDGSVLSRYRIEGNILSSLVVANNTMYIASLNKMLCAIDIDTEETLWEFESDEGFSASPTVNNNRLFIGSHDGTLSAVDLEMGQMLWSRNFNGPITQSARATSYMIYQVTKNGQLIAISPDRGDTLWEYELGPTQTQHPFAISNNMLFVMDSRNQLLTMDAFTGEVKHRMRMSHAPVSQLIIAHKKIFVVSASGHMVAFGR